jgi:hypothetical protein
MARKLLYAAVGLIVLVLVHVQLEAHVTGYGTVSARIVWFALFWIYMGMVLPPLRWSAALVAFLITTALFVIDHAAGIWGVLLLAAPTVFLVLLVRLYRQQPQSHRA